MLIEVGNRKFEISNPDKVFWEEEGLTKLDLINYYRKISPYILPYLKDRPQSLNRFPDGIKGPNFYHKNLAGIGPTWLLKEKIYSPANEKQEEYLICNNEETLAYMANLGAIEINPWSSRTQHLDKPDWAVLDLDPEDISFDEVKKVAIKVGEILGKAGIKGFPKTSGASGIHIYIPYEARYHYEDIKNLAHLIAILVNRELPEITSLERLPKNRQKKVYLDYLQNNRGQTLAAPYSVRPKPGAPVSTPLEWGELESRMQPTDFRIDNIEKRIKEKGDLFAPVLAEKNSFKRNLEAIERMLRGEL